MYVCMYVRMLPLGQVRALLRLHLALQHCAVALGAREPHIHTHACTYAYAYAHLALQHCAVALGARASLLTYSLTHLLTYLALQHCAVALGARKLHA